MAFTCSANTKCEIVAGHRSLSNHCMALYDILLTLSMFSDRFLLSLPRIWRDDTTQNFQTSTTRRATRHRFAAGVRLDIRSGDAHLGRPRSCTCMNIAVYDHPSAWLAPCFLWNQALEGNGRELGAECRATSTIMPGLRLLNPATGWYSTREGILLLIVEDEVWCSKLPC